jgi:hypothetical protein
MVSFLIFYAPFVWRNVKPVAKFLVPDLGIYVVDSVIGLLYRSAGLCSLADRYDNPMPESTISPSSGTMNLARDSWGVTIWHTYSNPTSQNGDKNSSKINVQHWFQCILPQLTQYPPYISLSLSFFLLTCQDIPYPPPLPQTHSPHITVIWFVQYCNLRLLSTCI